MNLLGIETRGFVTAMEGRRERRVKAEGEVRKHREERAKDE